MSLNVEAVTQVGVGGYEKVALGRRRSSTLKCLPMLSVEVRTGVSNTNNMLTIRSTTKIKL